MRWIGWVENGVSDLDPFSSNASFALLLVAEQRECKADFPGHYVRATKVFFLFGVLLAIHHKQAIMNLNTCSAFLRQ